jgi:hypothetical protein
MEHERRQLDEDRDRIMSAVKEAVDKTVAFAILQHKSECPIGDMREQHNRMYKEMFNGDDGEHGFFAEVRRGLNDLTARAKIEDERVRKMWNRSDKLALAAIFATLMIAIGTLVVPPTVVFFKDLYGMAQEYEKLHHSEIERQKSEKQDYNAHMRKQQQSSDLSSRRY